MSFYLEKVNGIIEDICGIMPHCFYRRPKENSYLQVGDEFGLIINYFYKI